MTTVIQMTGSSCSQSAMSSDIFGEDVAVDKLCFRSPGLQTETPTDSSISRRTDSSRSRPLSGPEILSPLLDSPRFEWGKVWPLRPESDRSLAHGI